MGGEEHLKVGEEGSDAGLATVVDNGPVSAVQTLGRAARR